MIGNFENTLQNTEKKTIWKINDCEELLKKRINDEFVITQIQKLEEKLTANVYFLNSLKNCQVQTQIKLIYKKI